MKKLFLALLFSLLATDAEATTYWTSSGAASTTLTDCDGDSDPGVYCTFASIYSGMSGGDTLKGKAGTYNVSISTNPKSGPSTSQKTTFTCETTADPPNGTTPVCIMRPTGTVSSVVGFSNATNWSWQNWKMDLGGSADTTNGPVFFVSHDTANTGWEFINMEMDGGSDEGHTANASISILGMQRNPDGLIRNSYFHHCKAAANPDCHGLYLSGSNVTIENNLIHDIGRVGGNAYGIQYYSSSSVAFSNGVIRFNRIYTANSGILVGASNTGAEVYGNVVYDIGRNGLTARQASGKVYNNTINAASTTGLLIENNCSASGCTVRNNLAFENGTNCTLGSSTNSNNTCSGTDTALVIDPNNATMASRDFNLIESSAAIGAGTTTGLPSGYSCPGNVCDTGAYQAPTRLGAVIENAAKQDYRITFNVASQGIRSGVGLKNCTVSNFAVRDDGAGTTEDTCTVVGTNVLSIDLNADMTSGVADDAYTRGTLTDNVNIGGTYAKVRTYSAAAATNNVGGSATVLEAIHYRCASWYASPTAMLWLREEDASNSTLRCPLKAGGFGAVAIAVTSTTAGGQAFEWHYNRNGSGYVALSNTCSTTAICFSATNAPSMADGQAISSAILTDPNADYDGGAVVAQQATQPVIDFGTTGTMNAIILVGSAAATAVGDVYCVQPAPAGGVVGSITQTKTPCFEIVQPAMGF